MFEVDARRRKTIPRVRFLPLQSAHCIFDGKALIVTMSRRIAAELYNEIVSIKPEWHDEKLEKGMIKVVMTTSSSDGPELAKHQDYHLNLKYYKLNRIAIVCVSNKKITKPQV